MLNVMSENGQELLWFDVYVGNAMFHVGAVNNEAALLATEAHLTGSKYGIRPSAPLEIALANQEAQELGPIVRHSMKLVENNGEFMGRISLRLFVQNLTLPPNPIFLY